MQVILHDRIPIADDVNAQMITLEEVPKGYVSTRAPVNCVLDLHDTVAKSA
jgi:glutathione-independent formaldehyde dehydrogenase